MAPRATSRARNHHKSKGERKKKEDKLLPAVLDVLVNLPSGEEVILKGISTDRILDVRKLLAVNVETCHLTKFSLSHQVRGDQLGDLQEVVHLKPCVLTLVEEAYTRDESIAHVRRLLDIVASTTCFGASGKASEQQEPKKGINSNKENIGGEAGLQDFADIARLCPPSKLGKFYEFFSFSHLKSPIQSVRKLPSEGTKDFFSLEVKVSNGKLLTVTACSGGFYHAGKQLVKSHTLVDLLRHLSKAFDDAYDELLKGFSDRNKFANIPYNLRANTWLVPPVAAESPSVFPPLPAEDEAWNGNGGGRGREPDSLEKPWAGLFALVANMPCSTPEERELRDHKAFVLHNFFVDVATTRAVELIKELDSRRSSELGEHVETRGTLRFRVARDVTDPFQKGLWKIESCSSTGNVSERNLLKGITADESTVVHDLKSLGVVLVRHQGYRAVVEALASETEVHGFDVPDPAEGGANALNANSLRTLLHKNPKSSKAPDEDKEIVQKFLEDGIRRMGSHQPGVGAQEFIRWELGACWIQHLGEKKKEKPATKELRDDDTSPLKDVLSEASLKRLRETGSGLHLKGVPELLHEAHQFYNEVALPKLVTDFAALELSPVEGRTLTDFMHIRGLRISSLGLLAELCSKLPHIRLLCIHEMVIRGLKHFIRALVASVSDASELPQTLATALNSIFGAQARAENLVWKWLALFVKARYDWRLSQDFWVHLRKYAVLRGLCYKVGIEMVSRDYDFESATPFQSTDLISMVPVYKHAICSSADGRTLLESSKTALDKGKLEDAVSNGSKVLAYEMDMNSLVELSWQALAKLIAVCGPYHRMTAGAYSLLAVVLYHTGDFVQAMTYQQKALDINERELGLDHPDTMKSYGDLAVFYYRLQHTELALRYVNRALYLLHLICGPSHPNTAATYINVAMMEEALGNPHVALRYLHEALKCNERLLGKNHIQTAASYHAIAIALSLMEAYSLSVHHEQTTFQILQAKLGPDDIRTQDAAAWLEYFDSKAVEQQEAARTGAPKPDPNVASKGHLSVSDLLNYINEEVAETNDKGMKKAKRLKILSSDHEELAKAGEEVGEALGRSKQGGAGDVAKQQLEPPQKPKQELVSSEKQAPKIAIDRRDEIQQLVNPPAIVQAPEDEGWLEATPRGKHHKKQPHRFHPPRRTVQAPTPALVPAQAPAQAPPAIESTPISRSSSFKEEKASAAPPPGDQTRSYRDVALMFRSTQVVRRPVAQAAGAPAMVGKAKSESTGTQKSDADDDSISQASTASQATGSSPRVGNAPVAVTPVKSSAGKAVPRAPPALTLHASSTTTVAVTPIRKQVLQKTSNRNSAPAPAPAPARSPPLAPAPVFDSTATPASPAAASDSDAAPAAAAAAAGVNRRKPMNPFAIEFVPGRKWHPVSPTSETNTLKTGGTGAFLVVDDEKQEEKEEEQQQLHLKKPAELGSDHPGEADQVTQEPNQEAEAEEVSASEAPADNDDDDDDDDHQLADDEEELPEIEKKDYYSDSNEKSDSSEAAAEQKSDSSEAAAAAGLGFGFKLEMKRVRSFSSSSRSRSKSRWQRRSDGAITRVYRIEGDKSSANPQLRTTSTFTDVPEPHTVQSAASIVRRSVRVS